MNSIDSTKNNKLSQFNILIWLLLFGIVSCTTPPQRHTLQGMALGTTYSIVYISTDKKVDREGVEGLLKDFEKSASIFDSTSLLSRINRGETDSIDQNIRECIEIAFAISEQTGGLYDITVKPLVEAYGFARKSAQHHPNIDSLMQYVGYKKVSISAGKIIKPQGVQLDLNSVAKGYSVDLVAKHIEQKGIENYLVEIGGEIFAKGQNDKGQPWQIGIDKPIDGNFNPGQDLQAIVPLENKGLASSGNYRRFYISEEGERINHTINPLTGHTSTNNLLSATIQAPTCAKADSYATAMMAMGAKKSITFLKSNPHLSAYLIYTKKGQLTTYEQ